MEEEEANAYMAFIATDYSKAMTDGGICNIFVENSKPPTADGLVGLFN